MQSRSRFPGCYNQNFWTTRVHKNACYQTLTNQGANKVNSLFRLQEPNTRDTRKTCLDTLETFLFPFFWKFLYKVRVLGVNTYTLLKKQLTKHILVVGDTRASHQVGIKHLKYLIFTSSQTQKHAYMRLLEQK